MPRPVPTTVLHFTRVEHLATIVQKGLLSDTLARETGATAIEIGHPDIKARRQRTRVPAEPGGVVGDYVPFYYAPRSPMMFAINGGRVPSYSGGCERIVYLVSTLERLAELGLDVLATDRNAVMPYATFQKLGDGLDDLVDWDLMRQRVWRNTPQQPDRKERRMAEALVHRSVPWSAFEEVVAKGEPVADEARQMIADAGLVRPVSVRPHWYF